MSKYSKFIQSRIKRGGDLIPGEIRGAGRKVKRKIKKIKGVRTIKNTIDVKKWEKELGEYLNTEYINQ